MLSADIEQLAFAVEYNGDDVGFATQPTDGGHWQRYPT